MDPCRPKMRLGPTWLKGEARILGASPLGPPHLPAFRRPLECMVQSGTSLACAKGRHIPLPGIRGKLACLDQDLIIRNTPSACYMPETQLRVLLRKAKTRPFPAPLCSSDHFLCHPAPPIPFSLLVSLCPPHPKLSVAVVSDILKGRVLERRYLSAGSWSVCVRLRDRCVCVRTHCCSPITMRGARPRKGEPVSVSVPRSTRFSTQYSASSTHHLLYKQAMDGNVLT
jgi:hypothetical protein